eukprot:14392601-Alexandrium_andersonii.AAC.1
MVNPGTLKINMRQHFRLSPVITPRTRDGNIVYAVARGVGREASQSRRAGTREGKGGRQSKAM